MTHLRTCKEFLQELSEFLDDSLDPELRIELQKHVAECPNCWVVCDTTKKTLKVFKGMQAQALPADVQSRLMVALEKKCQARRESRKKREDDQQGVGFEGGLGQH